MKSFVKYIEENVDGHVGEFAPHILIALDIADNANLNMAFKIQGSPMSTLAGVELIMHKLKAIKEQVLADMEGKSSVKKDYTKEGSSILRDALIGKDSKVEMIDGAEMQENIEKKKDDILHKVTTITDIVLSSGLSDEIKILAVKHQQAIARSIEERTPMALIDALKSATDLKNALVEEAENDNPMAEEVLEKMSNFIKSMIDKENEEKSGDIDVDSIDI